MPEEPGVAESIVGGAVIAIVWMILTAMIFR